MKFANKRFPPTEPGNDSKLYGDGKGRGHGVSGSCTYENLKQEKIGRGLARLCLSYSYAFQLIVFLVMLVTSLQSWDKQTVGDMFQYWVVGMAGSVILLTLGRLISNRLTRKEEDLRYKALVILFLGGLAQFIIFVVLDCMVS